MCEPALWQPIHNYLILQVVNVGSTVQVMDIDLVIGELIRGSGQVIRTLQP